jgi:pyruvate dehydrogenase E1 component alpha subunit
MAVYCLLTLIRRVELKVEELYPQDQMKTPIHSSLGQEAAAVGICIHLKKEDFIFSNHRSHAHYLAKFGNLPAMIAELYCKETGCSRGRGGSMHLIDFSVGHPGSSAIVGGSIPHAVGAALAFKLRREARVAVSFFGDAASEQGVFFESMNWAKLKRLPVIFVCENNSYSVCSHISARQPDDAIAKRARAFDIPAKAVDGMNIFAVYEAGKEAIEHARSGKGPYLLELKVQRWRAHAGAGDPGKEKYRIPDDLQPDWQRDPLKDYQDYLLGQHLAQSADLERINSAVDQEIAEAFRFAQASPLPRKEDLEKYLFAE